MTIEINWQTIPGRSGENLRRAEYSSPVQADHYYVIACDDYALTLRCHVRNGKRDAANFFSCATFYIDNESFRLALKPSECLYFGGCHDAGTAYLAASDFWKRAEGAPRGEQRPAFWDRLMDRFYEWREDAYSSRPTKNRCPHCNGLGLIDA